MASAGDIATVTIDRPPVNAFDWEMVRQVRDTLDRETAAGAATKRSFTRSTRRRGSRTAWTWRWWAASRPGALALS